METKFGCINEDRHEYAQKTCSNCGRDFCYACCKGTNVDQGGKHESDFMICPHCGNDYYGR